MRCDSVDRGDLLSCYSTSKRLKTEIRNYSLQACSFNQTMPQLINKIPSNKTHCDTDFVTIFSMKKSEFVYTNEYAMQLLEENQSGMQS